MSRHRNRRNMLMHGSEQVKLTNAPSAFAIGKRFDKDPVAKAGPKVEEKPKPESREERNFTIPGEYNVSAVDAKRVHELRQTAWKAGYDIHIITAVFMLKDLGFSRAKEVIAAGPRECDRYNGLNPVPMRGQMSIQGSPSRWDISTPEQEALLSPTERERLWLAATPWKTPIIRDPPKDRLPKFVPEDVEIDFASKGRPDLLAEFSKIRKKDPTSPDCEISPTDKKDDKGNGSK